MYSIELGEQIFEYPLSIKKHGRFLLCKISS
jgi:hypothetical protein